MSDTDSAGDRTVNVHRVALVSVLLLLLGATILTVGISLAFGVPAGLIGLGGLLIAGGVLLGLT